MVESGILYIEYDRLLAKVENGVMHLHRHDYDHILLFMDFHLINTFQPYFGNKHPVFRHFCSHGTLLDRGLRASMIPHESPLGRCCTAARAPPLVSNWIPVLALLTTVRGVEGHGRWCPRQSEGRR